eukprot:PhM_4_TR14133/c2_g1_i1/m.39432/K00297/metF, MTHFR; methylenetetrahydrofolate reductase (NADPH)
MASPQPKIIDLLKANEASGTRAVSFEYFPPKTEKGDEALMNRLEKMAALKPLFVDFTWGAGGSTADKTPQLCLQTMKRCGLVVNMHLTCTNMDPSLVDKALAFCKEHGITNIVALRGDPPAGQAEWKAVEGGFTCALDLVKYIREHHGDYFCLSVAGYPEGHPNVIGEDGKCTPESMEKELDYLKAKIDAGADLIITQLFFEPQLFVDFKKACAAKGINVPILPGLLPILNYGGFQRMTSFCKTFVPESVKAATEAKKEDDEAFRAYGIEMTTEMCKFMEKECGQTHFHFYTLNLDHSTEAVMTNLGLKP